MNKRQTYNSNGIYAHEFYFCNNFERAIVEVKLVLHCEGYDYEDFPVDIKKAPLSQLIFLRRMKILSRPDRFMLNGALKVVYFSTSELVYAKK